LGTGAGDQNTEESDFRCAKDDSGECSAKLYGDRNTLQDMQH